jgi:hypothetical protein
MRKLAAVSLIVILPMLSSCETVQAVRDFKVSDYINLPWDNKKPSEPVRTADAALPALKTADTPTGLQQDDLRAPFGDDQTAVAAR